MPDLFEMKRPLSVNFTDGSKTIAVAYYPHAQGMVFLEPFWEQKADGQKALVVKGDVKGDGPWRVGNAVFSLVGCQGTDPDLAQLLAEWEFHLQSVGAEYYEPEQIRELAREYGALI
jgi:hypothetical protein